MENSHRQLPGGLRNQRCRQNRGCDADRAPTRSLRIGPDMTKQKRERPKRPLKITIELFVDPDLLARYQSTGAGWQTRMHQALQRGLKDLRVNLNKRTQ